MAGPTIVVIAGLVTLWLAVKSADGLVADDYYKQGIAINRILARAERAQALGLEARMAVHEGQVQVRLSSRSGAELPPRIRLTFAHATRSGLDQAFLLVGGGGSYAGAVGALPAGHWQVLIEDEAETWRLASAASLSKSGEIVLRGTR